MRFFIIPVVHHVLSKGYARRGYVPHGYRYSHGRRGSCHVAGSRTVAVFVVQSARVVGIRERASTSNPEFCLTRSSLTFFRGEVQVGFENRSTADAVVVRLLASKNDQKIVGCTITRTRAAGTTAEGVGSGSGFKAALELLDVHPQLPEEAPITVRLTPGSWRFFRVQKR